MGTWSTSWYWSWRPIATPPPSPPMVMPEERKSAMGTVIDQVLQREREGVPFLALAHERLAEQVQAAGAVRLEYRVSARSRFVHVETVRGPARTALAHVARLDASGKLGATRGPFHLAEVIAQGGICVITVRLDVLLGEPEARLGLLVPVAVTRSITPLEPIRFGLYDPVGDKLLWANDDLLSRAWHATGAGGEILAALPGHSAPMRARSGAFRTGAAAGDVPRKISSWGDIPKSGAS